MLQSLGNVSAKGKAKSYARIAIVCAFDHVFSRDDRLLDEVSDNVEKTHGVATRNDLSR